MHEIVLEGSPYERGITHGRQFADIIKAAIIEYCKFGGAFTERINLYGRRMFDYLQNSFPDLVEELRGISDGAQIDFGDILLLNFFPGLLNLPIYCTNIAFVNSCDGPIHGRTSDIGSDYHYYLLQRVTPNEGGQEFLSVNWAGTIWTGVGINASGLSVGQSSAPTAPGQDGIGISTLIMPRPVLQYCRNTREAMNLLERFRLAGKGLNVALLDETGDAAVVEKSHDKQAVREAEEGVVFCSNHFVEETMQGMIPLRIDGIEENSTGRYQLLSNIFGTDKNIAAHGIEGMKKLLRIHANDDRPGICQHVPPNLISWYAYILLPRKREMWICDGPPCQTEFAEYAL